MTVSVTLIVAGIAVWPWVAFSGSPCNEGVASIVVTVSRTVDTLPDSVLQCLLVVLTVVSMPPRLPLLLGAVPVPVPRVVPPVVASVGKSGMNAYPGESIGVLQGKVRGRVMERAAP